MSKRWSRRLAGCTAIELLLAAGGAAAGFEYKAGTAATGQARALALEDRRGTRVVIAEGEFGVTRTVADFAAAQIMKSYGVSRAGLVFRGRGDGAAAPRDLVTAVSAALGALEPGVVRFGGGTLSVATPDGRCRAAIRSDGWLDFDGCGGGEPVRSPLRAAFRTVEPSHGLQKRGETAPAYPVQAIALGKQAAILALSGPVPPGRFAAPRRIVAPFSNDASAPPEDSRVDAAIRDVLARVGR